MDEFAFYNSQQETKNDFIFQNSQFVWVPDSNNGSYPNSQVIFDLASLSNSGKFIDFQSSYITVPLVADITNTSQAANNAENLFACSLKNGFHQLINSISVEITNAQVVNLTNFSNLDINYRLLTTCSREDEVNFLPSINFHKDTAESIYYSDVTSANGIGESNNILANSVFSTTSGWGNSFINHNEGRLKRALNTSFDPVDSSIGSANFKLVNSATVKTSGKNFAEKTGNTSVQYYILATIPLKIIHDLFKQLPLTRNMYMRLILNLNTQCQCAIDVAANKFTGFTTTSLNNVFPLMVSPIGDGKGIKADSAITKSTITLGIGKSYNTATSYSHPVMTSCRLYSKLLEFAPMYEELYLSSVPTKTILYNDILTFQTLSVGAGSSVSQILTNGISRPRYLLIVPQMAGVINGSAKANLASTFTAAASNGLSVLGSPMNSPFSSAPGTTAPQAVISSLNILVSGQNIYQSNYQYGFEQYLQEVRGSNSLNGGLPLALSSGLLSQQDWENGYRFIYVDLSRRVSQANDDISRSIQVQFQNSATYAIDYFYVIGYQKQLSISTSTGSLII